MVLYISRNMASSLIVVLLLLLFAVRVGSSSQQASESVLCRDMCGSLERSLCVALFANSDNTEQISRYFSTPHILLNVTFQVDIAPQNFRVKRSHDISGEKRSYSFLLSTAFPLLFANYTYFCQLQPKLQVIIQYIACQLIRFPNCKKVDELLDGGCYFDQHSIELSLSLGHLPSPTSYQDVQTALEKFILPKVSTLASLILP